MLITMASSAAALLLFAAAFLTYEYVASGQTMKQDLSTLAEIIGNRSTAALTFDDKAGATEILRALSAKKGVVAAAFYYGNQVFAQYHSVDAEGRPPLPFVSVPAKPGPDECRFEGAAIVLFQPIEFNGETIGTIYLKSDLQELHARLWRYALIMLVFTVLSLAATYLLAARLQRIISRPIFHLAQTAKTVSTGKNYLVRAQKQSDDELGGLTDDFNEMLGQIQQRDTELERARNELEIRVVARTSELQQQFTRINLLNQITHAIAARQDFDSIVLVVLQQLEDHLPIDYGSAYHFDAPTATLRAMARGPKSRPIAEKLHISSVIDFGQTPFQPGLQGELVYIPDNRRTDLAIANKMSGAGFFSTVGAPLIVDGKVFGFLVLVRCAVDGFSAAEREFIRGLSAHVSLAIFQAQLFQDLQKAYDELRQTQQTVMQQERLKALGQMASGVAHDINNALSPIIGFAELIEKAEPGLTAATKKHLQYIKTAGEDIAHIVAGLREFYRPRDDRESLQTLNLNHVAEQVVDMTRARWRDMPQSRGIMIELQTDFDPQLPRVVGIESEMREAFTNLILNAVDALPHGGAITVRTRAACDQFGDPDNSGHAILEIRDTGTGMDELTRKRCLEPFFSTKGQRGTGLGLAMVYGVVERHEGRIEIESAPGRGTTMRLIFPVRRTLTAAITDPVAAAELGTLRILCIDDEPLVLELVQQMLENDGHKVSVSDGGQAGVNAFRAARERNELFDAVITDLGMPYLDGREVARIVKLEAPGTAVIMLTGWGAFMKEDGSAPAEIDGLLSKPPRSKELREMLQRVVRKSNPKTA